MVADVLGRVDCLPLPVSGATPLAEWVKPFTCYPTQVGLVKFSKLPTEPGDPVWWCPHGDTKTSEVGRSLVKALPALVKRAKGRVFEAPRGATCEPHQTALMLASYRLPRPPW